MAKTVVGIFKNRANAETAIDELQTLGYDTKNLSVIMKDYRKKDGMKMKGANVVGGAAAGATTGAVVGGIAGLLAGIGILTIPGIGPLLVAGPIASALGLTGTTAATVTGAATGALAGGLLGSLIGLGIPEKQAKVYEEYIRAGGILLVVPTRNIREEEAENILRGHNATDIKVLELPRDAGIREDTIRDPDSRRDLPGDRHHYVSSQHG